MKIASLARAYKPTALAAALALAGCSAQVEGLAGEASALVGERCGWQQSAGSPFAPESECQVLATEGNQVGLWREGDDPCEVPAAKELRVEPGEPYAEWQRVGAGNVTVDVEPCGP
jgi:hypothetical protein